MKLQHQPLCPGRPRPGTHLPSSVVDDRGTLLFRLLALLIIYHSSFIIAAGQNITLEGRVVDSAGVALPAASVVLLEKQDSVLNTFGLADGEGRFSLRRVEPGDYILQISYLGYRNHWQAVQLRAGNQKVDLGAIVMQQASAELAAVEVKADRAPLALRNDTLEYNAAAFKVQPGAVVEDLLKKLPGVQVQPDGSIRAQGEQVRKVLVDGKEFFGDDPKIATKNLPADAVNKVQVYDKKSDRAEFTGIEDGRDEKTINLKLKDDKKQGYFGNATMGGGTEGRYEGRFNVNRFGRRTQMSALGMANNTNQQGFSFEDYINFMGGLGNFMSGGGGGSGGVRISLNSEDVGGLAGGGLQNGFTTTWAGGTNLNTEFSKRTSLSVNYFYNRLQNETSRTASRENLLGSQNFGSEEAEDRLSRNANHRLNLTLKHKLDSFQNLTLRSRLTFNDALFSSLAQSQTYDPEGAEQNRGLRDYDSDGEQLRGNASLVYRRRFGRRGRALVADASFNSGSDRRAGLLFSENIFFRNGLPDTLPVRQRQAYDDAAANWGGSLSYTEPLGRRRYIEWTAEHQQYANRTTKDFYDRSADTPTPGEVFNPLLSNRFRRGYRYERAGLNYLLNRSKYNLTAGAAVQHSALEGELLSSETTLRRTFTRVLPAVFFNYDFKTGRDFGMEYTTALREPSLEQLQPVVDNSDPLSTYTGNPDLRPEYAHTLSTRFLNFDQFTMTSIFANLNATYVRDRITNASTVDSLFRRNLRPLNVAQDFTLNGYASFNTPLRFIKTNLNLTLNTTYNRGILFVNEDENTTDRWVNAAEIRFDNRKKDWVDWSIGTNLSRNSTRYSVSTALDQAFLNQRYFGEITVFPTKKWAVGTGLDYSVYSKEAFGERRAVPLWRASLTRYVLKNNKGQIKIAAFDLLNRNIGIRRNSQFNFVEEERVRNLGRYVMASFAYSLAGFQREKGGVEIRL
jgi:hypothetical protein